MYIIIWWIKESLLKKLFCRHEKYDLDWIHCTVLVLILFHLKVIVRGQHDRSGKSTDHLNSWNGQQNMWLLAEVA